MKKQKIRVGLDFDGVLAYNPFRLIRAPVTYIKRNLLGIKKLVFYVPRTPFERFMWTVVHESSIFPAIGTNRLKQMSQRSDVEFYLVTARFHFLQTSVNCWLKRYGLNQVFKGIYLNIEDKQPHIHKLEMIEKLKLDYFVEDNWDIVSDISVKTKSKVFWIYNFFDRNYPWSDKYPYLDKALIEIQKQLSPVKPER